MIIKIHKREDPYARIDNRALNDKRLSYRARGILAYLLSKPRDWTVRTEQVVEGGTEGREAVRTAFKELAKFGYAQLRNTSQGREWVIIEEGATAQEPVFGPPPRKANMEKPVSLVTKEKSTNERPGDFLLSLQADRIAALFKRRKTTPWSEKEVKAWKKLTKKGLLDDDMLIMVERYYLEARRKGDNYCRRDLLTFLNNYPGEVDRAIGWCEKHPLPGTRKIKAPTVQKEIELPPPDPEAEARFLLEFERVNHRLPYGYSRNGGKIVKVPGRTESLP